MFITTFLVFCIISFLFHNTSGFYTGETLKNSWNGLSRATPLKTAGVQSYGLIPRLEPGLRIIKKFNYESTNDAPFETFSLDILRDLPLAQQIAIPQLSKPVIPKIPLNLLFDRVRALVSSLLTRFAFFAKKVMSYTSLFTTLVSPFNSRFAPKAALAAGTVGGIISTAALPVKAGLLSYKRLSPVQRVATTPLYFVCNSRGNAYLQEDVQGGNPEQRTVVYFMSYQDADNYMNEMTQSNPSHASEFRIMTVSMEKVLNLIQNKKQSRKMARYEIDMIYRIQPSSQQTQNAEKLAGKQALSEYSIPMFAAEGVAVKRKTGEVITPYYFSYEDLLNDWEKLRESSPKLPASPKVVVKDFTDVMVLADGNAAISFEDKVDDKVIANEGLSVAQIKEALLTPGVVPSRDEIERLRSYYREKGTVKGEFSKAKLFASP